jgi:hypothetical protein
MPALRPPVEARQGRGPGQVSQLRLSPLAAIRGEGLAAHLAEVFQLYEVPEDQRDKIIAYVQQYRGVAHALRKAVPELERVFGKTSRRLDIEVDPESGWEELFGVVLLKEYPENAFELLHHFDQWFLQAPAEVRMNRNFNVATEDDYTAV